MRGKVIIGIRSKKIEIVRKSEIIRNGTIKRLSQCFQCRERSYKALFSLSNNIFQRDFFRDNESRDLSLVTRVYTFHGFRGITCHNPAHNYACKNIPCNQNMGIIFQYMYES